MVAEQVVAEQVAAEQVVAEQVVAEQVVAAQKEVVPLPVAAARLRWARRLEAHLRMLHDSREMSDEKDR